MAADLPTSDANKTKLAGWVLANFPPVEKVTVKDSIVNNYITSKVTDTVYEYIGDNLVKYIYNTDTLLVEKYKVKEVIKLDTVGNWLRQVNYKNISDTANHYKNEYIMATNNLNACSEDLAASDAANNKLWVYVIGLALLLVGSHILRNKLKF